MPGVLGMGNLVVKRCRGERIMIGESIIVSVRDVGRNCADLEVSHGGRISTTKVLALNDELPVNHEITLSLVTTKGNACRIRVTAPMEIPVHREEVARQIAEAAATLRAREPLSELAQQIGEIDGFPIGQLYDPDVLGR